MRFFAIATFILTAGAVAAGSYNGRYQPQGFDWNCQDVGQDGGALEVSETQLIGVENTCQLSNPVNVRNMEATLYDAQCSGQGATESYRMMLLKSDDGLVVIARGMANKLSRCE